MSKLSKIINYPLSLMGLKIARLSSISKLQEAGIVNLTDIEKDKVFLELYEKVKDFTLVEIERCYALYRSVNYVLQKKIPGDFVECGVWKGGSAMLMAYTLLSADVRDRKIILYDTYEGMIRPGENDGKSELKKWKSEVLTSEINKWCYAPIETVQDNMYRTNYPNENIVFIKGKVEATIPANAPEQIALLRLDTDWYESTLHELTHLYPLLEKSGILIIDDYGQWDGARKATDKYFESGDPVLMNRIDFSGRLIIK